MVGQIDRERHKEVVAQREKKQAEEIFPGDQFFAGA